ncbi:ribonuclease H-like domain-containing protein [Tanacetum coccineum]
MLLEPVPVSTKGLHPLKTQLDDLRIEFIKSEFNLATYKIGLAFVEEQLVFYKKNKVIFCEQLPVFQRDISYKDSEISILKSELEKLKQEKESNQLKIEKFNNASKKEFQQPKFEGYGPKTSKSVSENISNKVKESPDALLVEELVLDDKLEKKTADCNYHQRERVVSGNNYTRVNYNYSTKQAHPSAHRNIVPRAVLMKTSLRPLNTTRPVNTAPPKTTVYSARRMLHFSKSAQSTGTCLISQTSRNLMEDMLPLGEEPNEGKLLVKELLKLLADESQVLLKVPRKNNMYSVDMKNIVPKECLTCLVANATLDESMLWHRRLVVTDDYSRFTCVFFLATKDKTSGILKRFITETENLVDKKVKIIICNNGTKFKNRVISEFCEEKGIEKEFSAADSKLPTTFWAEAVNIACYVQNRVLVVKPHNKTLYELFRGRTPALSFMRPFGCHVTILNTLDYLGKFDGKSDEDSLFLEDKPIIADDGPKWLFDIDVLTKSMNYMSVVARTNSNDLVGTEESIGACHSSKETRSNQDYILMPLWKDGSLFDSSLKNACNDEPQPSSDAKKKDGEGVNKESGIDDQVRPKNSTQDVNTARPSINTASTNVNAGSLNINIVSPTVTTAPLEATHADFFSDET